jgi:hypothetical protein
MKKAIAIGALGPLLVGASFWAGRRSAKTSLPEVYNPQTRRWEILQVKAFKNGGSIFIVRMAKQFKSVTAHHSN